MFISPCDQKTARALYEKVRWGVCVVRTPPIATDTSFTLGETVEWTRRVPRSARVAQGFPRIVDFARKVKQLRDRRAELRRQQPDPLRRAILDTLVATTCA